MGKFDPKLDVRITDLDLGIEETFRKLIKSSVKLGLIFVTPFVLLACTPRVELASPEKPVTINLNVKIDHEVRVKVERDIDALFDEKKEIF